MPADAAPRQPEDALGWFSQPAGRSLLAAEGPAIERVLAACPALPWLWLGLQAAAMPEAGGRGVLLRRTAGQWDGTMRCAARLPLVSESFGAVLVQHALDGGSDSAAVLDECSRVLAPGGTLWLAALNPWTPYRLRWARSGLHARDPGRWQVMLGRSGFAVDSVRLHRLGPHWHVDRGEAGIGVTDRLRAGLALTVSKRVHAAVPPRPLRQLRWQTGRASRTASTTRATHASRISQ